MSNAYAVIQVGYTHCKAPFWDYYENKLSQTIFCLTDCAIFAEMGVVNCIIYKPFDILCSHQIYVQQYEFRQIIEIIKTSDTLKHGLFNVRDSRLIVCDSILKTLQVLKVITWLLDYSTPLPMIEWFSRRDQLMKSVIQLLFKLGSRTVYWDRFT